MRWLRCLSLCWCAALMLAGGVRAVTPFQAVQAAAADAASLVASGINPHQIRYALVPNGTAQEQADWVASASYVLNSLNSHSPVLVPMVRVGPGGCLLRVDLHALGIDPKDWDSVLATGSGSVPIPEYAFNVLLQQGTTYTEDVDYGYWVDGYGRTLTAEQRQTAYRPHWVKTETRKVQKTRDHTFQSPGLWVSGPDGGASILALSTLTDSRTPILSVSWLCVYFLWSPGYYTLLHVDPNGNLDQIDKLARVDEVLAAAARVQWLAGSKRVTPHDRIGERFPTVARPTGSSYHQTFDSKTGIDGQDFLRHFVDAFQVKAQGRRLVSRLLFDATEVIWTQPNGLRGGALTDNKLKLLNAAVSAIANDTVTGYGAKLSDTNVYTYRNCFQCHDRQGGFYEIDDKVRRLSTQRLILALQAKVKSEGQAEKAAEVIAAIEAAYSLDPNPILHIDNADYAAVVAACTGGRTPKSNAEIIERQTLEYLGDVTPEIAAAEAGLDVKVLLEALRHASGLDYTVTSLIQEPPVPVSRTVWERQGYQQMMTLLAQQGLFGVPPPLVGPKKEGEQ